MLKFVVLFVQAIDYRVEFTKWWVNEFKTIKFPAQGTVFDYYIDTETKEFLLWTERLPVFTLDPDMPLQVFVYRFYIPLLL
jgi:dynein heavy chain